MYILDNWNYFFFNFLKNKFMVCYDIHELLNPWKETDLEREMFLSKK